jgi:hypothetical protein
MKLDLFCRECGKSGWTRLSMQVDRGERGLVRFRVDCDRCGAFSHFLEHSEIQEAVRRYLQEASIHRG